MSVWGLVEISSAFRTLEDSRRRNEVPPASRRLRHGTALWAESLGKRGGGEDGSVLVA